MATIAESLAILGRRVRTLFDFIEKSKWPPYRKCTIDIRLYVHAHRAKTLTTESEKNSSTTEYGKRLSRLEMACPLKCDSCICIVLPLQKLHRTPPQRHQLPCIPYNVHLMFISLQALTPAQTACVTDNDINPPANFMYLCSCLSLTLRDVNRLRSKPQISFWHH